MNLKNKKLEKFLIIFIVILVCVLLLISILLISNISKNKDLNDNINENNENTNSEDSQVIEDGYTEEEQIQFELESEETYNESKLEIKDDLFTYLWMKQCINNYYSATSVSQALGLIDDEAKSILGINENSVRTLYNGFNNPEFCIDEIYQQKITSRRSIYIVYLRLKKNSSANLENTVILVKLDEIYGDFSIYPYEYLQKKGYTGLKENDIVELDSTGNIAENDYNKYTFLNMIISDKLYLDEFYERYKFDIKYDAQNLYNKIDEEYRNLKYPSISDFLNYVNSNKETICNNTVEKYQITEGDNYTQYMALCDDGNYYIFNAQSIMDYTIILDNYTVGTETYSQVYQASLPKVRAQYCIDRVIKAINNKDYNFVYEKLNPILKNNYYSNYSDFEEFIKNNFYEQNDYELGNYIEVSSDVYQYTVILTDSETSVNVYRNLTITITLKENEEFNISLKFE